MTTTDRTTRLGALLDVLTDDRFDRDTNLLRLQGWRGDDLARATAAPAYAHRVGPLFCGAASLLVAVTGSMPLLAVTLATALVGIVGANHPVETTYNAIAGRTGRGPLPPNRAAKRLGCLMGSLHLGGAAIAYAVGATTVATVLLVALGSLALFVAATGICVPSMMSALSFGVARGTARHLVGRPPVATPRAA